MNQTKRLWDRIAPGFSAVMGISLPHRDLYQEILLDLQMHDCSRVLDAGCGTGVFEQLAATFPQLCITGVDFSEEMIVQSMRRCVGVPNVDFKQVDLDEKLPFADNEFDTIVAFQSMFAVPRLEATLQEFKRVLRPCGRIIIADHKPSFSLISILRQHFTMMLSRGYIMATLVRLPVIAFLLPCEMSLERCVKDGAYHMRGDEEWGGILSSMFKIEQIGSCLADQCWLIKAVKLKLS